MSSTKTPMCGECHYYEPDSEDDGFCRRYPPLSRPDEDEKFWTVPVVMSGGWCGEFRPLPQQVSPGRSDKEIEKMAEARKLRRRNIEKRFGVKEKESE